MLQTKGEERVGKMGAPKLSALPSKRAKIPIKLLMGGSTLCNLICYPIGFSRLLVNMNSSLPG